MNHQFEGEWIMPILSTNYQSLMTQASLSSLFNIIVASYIQKQTKILKILQKYT